MTTHSSILKKIPQTEELGGYSPWDLKEADTTVYASSLIQHISTVKIYN